MTLPPALVVLGWISVLVAGLALALFASSRTVRHAQALAAASRLPPFFLGVTLLAVGTDLPEIANSLVASFSGHGDLNAGDSIGSAVTQATLILGLLPILTHRFPFSRARVFLICTTCMVCLAGGALLMRDGDLSRVDGLVLVAGWIVGSAVIWRHLPSHGLETPSTRVEDRWTEAAAATLGYLVLVGAGAAAAVAAFARLSDLFGVPEYVLSFFVASIGTSLPELLVGVVALRAGQRGMALGDVLGATFMDSTLSIGIGPLLFPTAVTASLAVTGSITAVVVLGLVALIMALASRHNRLTGSALVALYLGVYYVMLS